MSFFRELLRQSWRIRLTASGAGFLLLCGLIFLLGINYSNNLIFTFSFLLLGCFGVSIWLGLRNLSDFEARCLPVESVHAGQPVQYQLQVREQGGRAHYALSTLNQEVLNDLSDSPDETQTWHLRIDSETRGVLPESAMRVQSEWPLGLLRISRELCQLPEVVIFPSAKDLRAMQQHYKGSNAHLHEEAEALAGLRDYQPGDNLRRIDWRAMARRDQLQVKQFDGAAGDPSVWLRWEDTEGLGYEERIHCLCHWILDCYQRGQEFGIALPEQEYQPACDFPHLQRSLTALALMPGDLITQEVAQ
ncbi:MAG: DUF58 domain-containing protein [Amphritea sp.]|nr:DUF58 domain-containing protein [Amphritea sp.]